MPALQERLIRRSIVMERLRSAFGTFLERLLLVQGVLEGFRSSCDLLCFGDLRKWTSEGVVASERVQRRLAAILAADVAGYSRLMHHDEEATHAKLMALLADSVTPAITEHGGRIVKNTGDGLLAEFSSAVECRRPTP